MCATKQQHTETKTRHRIEMKNEGFASFSNSGLAQPIILGLQAHFYLCLRVFLPAPLHFSS